MAHSVDWWKNSIHRQREASVRPDFTKSNLGRGTLFSDKSAPSASEIINNTRFQI
jgi:hypothetical protein